MDGARSSRSSALPLLPLLRASHAQAPTFWARLEPFGLGVTYDAVFGHLLSKPFAIGAGVIFAIALAGSIRSRPERRPSSRRLEVHEVMAGLVTLAIPAAGMLVSELADGVFVPRYVLPSVLGLALVAPLAVWRLGPDDSFADVLLCVALLVPFALDAGRSFGPALTGTSSAFDDRPVLRERLADPNPIVLAGASRTPALYDAPSLRGLARSTSPIRRPSCERPTPTRSIADTRAEPMGAGPGD